MLTKLRKLAVVLLGLGMVAFGGGLSARHKAAAQETKRDDDTIFPALVFRRFPEGRDYNFGKVKRGTLVKHAFRIVNWSNVPLSIISVRSS